jgi:hypothetical protein
VEYALSLADPSFVRLGAHVDEAVDLIRRGIHQGDLASEVDGHRELLPIW